MNRASEFPSSPNYKNQFLTFPMFMNKLESLEKCKFKTLEFLICHGNSYNSPPTTKSPKDEQLFPVVNIDYEIFGEIYITLKNGVLSNTNEEIKKIYEIIQKCPHKTITFNFECCSGIAKESFPYEEETFEAIGYFLRNSYTVQVVDLSLKCLISAWKKFESNQNLISLFGGLCPMKQIETFSNYISFNFNPQLLLECRVVSSQNTKIKFPSLVEHVVIFYPGDGSLIFGNKKLSQLSSQTITEDFVFKIKTDA